MKNIYETLLHQACKSGNIEIVKYLISLNKIDINAKTILIFDFYNISFFHLFRFFQKKH